eukprot:2481619-Pyramimonas_sp.AAC.2
MPPKKAVAADPEEEPGMSHNLEFSLSVSTLPSAYLIGVPITNCSAFFTKSKPIRAIIAGFRRPSCFAVEWMDCLPVHATPRMLSPRTGLEGEERATPADEPEPTFVADFSFDFFLRGAPPPDAKGKVTGGDPREKAVSEEMTAANTKGGCEMKWKQALEATIDEDFVRFMASKSCRTGVKITFFNAAIESTEEEPIQCFIPLDCAPFLLGKTKVTSMWPAVNVKGGGDDLLQGEEC